MFEHVRNAALRNCEAHGVIIMSLAEVTAIGSARRAPRRLRWAAGNPILVDSSFRSVADAKEHQYLTCRRNPEQELSAQPGRHGMSPEQIGLLIHTHVHMDHAGQDHLVPGARILVQRRELQNAAAPDMYPAPFYDRLNVARLVHELWPRVEVLDGEVEIIPGVRCVPMPGHTPGHQAVYVAVPSGTAITPAMRP